MSTVLTYYTILLGSFCMLNSFDPMPDSVDFNLLGTEYFVFLFLMNIIEFCSRIQLSHLETF